jgi:biotin operon repressor
MYHLEEDWLHDRINLDYKKENLAELPHLEHLRRVEGRIMMFLRFAEGGISHLELARKVGINRKNLTSHMKRLITKGLVIRGRGKHGKYYPASKKHRGLSITAQIFSEAAADRILTYGDFPINSPYFENRVVHNDPLDNYPLDKALFKFSNVIGAVITYLIIQSMDRSNEIPGRDAKNTKEQDINVERWFNDGISTLGTYLLNSFKEYTVGEFPRVPYYYAKEDGTVDGHRMLVDFNKYLYTRPLFTLDEKSIRSLMMSFRRIYPSIDAQLETIRSDSAKIVNRMAAYEQYRTIRDKQQKICEHTFKPPRSLLPHKGEKLMHCQKCHKTLSTKI